MICACCGHKREAGQKHVECVRNSRRLREAWAEIQKQIAILKQSSKDLTPVLCEGSDSLRVLIKGMMAKCADQLRKRFRYLDVVPWALVNCHTIDGAKH